MSGRIKSWSYSTLKSYKTCPLKVKLAKIDRTPEPSSPQMERGTRIHALAEDYLKHKIDDVPSELSRFHTDIITMREQGASAEEEWGFNREWEPVPWSDPSCWLRMKIDVKYLNADWLLIADWKTGRRYDDHRGQMSIYALGGFIKHPEVHDVTASMIYTDSGESWSETFTRDEVPDLISWWEDQSRPLLNDEVFAPRPGPHCRWCFYSKHKNGNCEF